MKLAIVYAGQGSQKVGMGRDFYEKYPSFRALLDGADAGFDVKAVSYTHLDVYKRQAITRSG